MHVVDFWIENNFCLNLFDEKFQIKEKVVLKFLGHCIYNVFMQPFGKERYLLTSNQQYGPKTTNTFKVAKGITEGDTIAPQSVNLALERIFRKIDWSDQI